MSQKSEHALLSASSSSRWLKCTPSARMSEQFKNNDTDFTREGTLAHSIAERILKGKSVDTTKITPAMLEYVKSYTDFCIAERDKYPDGLMLIEQHINLSKYVPKSFGTADCLILSKSKKCIDVIDFKYGRGVLVEAKRNTQLMLYGLGCLEIARANGIEVEKVFCTIFQPRLQNVGTYILSRQELIEWGESIMPTAIKAYYGDGKTNAGDWCRFCPAKVRCRSYAGKIKELEDIKKDFNVLTNEELAQLLDSLVELTNYINNIKEELKQALLENDNSVKGYRIKEVSGPRILTANALSYLNMIGVKTTEEKQRSITKLKSIYGGKFIEEAIDGLTVTGAPKYQLVKIKDDLKDVFKDVNVE